MIARFVRPNRTGILAGLSCLALAIGMAGSFARAEEPPPTSPEVKPVAVVLPEVGANWQVKDSLGPIPEGDTEAAVCLKPQWWTAAEFRVTTEGAPPDKGSRWLRYPSPRPSGNAVVDHVCLEWWPAITTKPGPQPAVVIIHESGSSMIIGRMAARGLSERGLNAFMIHLPCYGARRPTGNQRLTADQFVAGLLQAGGDVRRAYDVVHSLPEVDSQNLSLLGISLGGFICANSAGFDPSWNRYFVFLAGGDLYRVVTEGKIEAEMFREIFAKAGYTGDRLKSYLGQVEPLRVANRVDPKIVWAYAATFDPVVPPTCTTEWTTAIRLASDHIKTFWANHHSAIIYLPVLLNDVRAIIDPA